MYNRPPRQLKDIYQKRLTPKSAFLKQLEKAQAKLLHPEVRAQLTKQELDDYADVQLRRLASGATASPGVTAAGQRLREALKPKPRKVTLLNSYRKRRNP